MIPFMGNQVTQDTFTTQVTCDPLSESDIPGFVGEVKGFCLGRVNLYSRQAVFLEML